MSYRRYNKNRPWKKYQAKYNELLKMFGSAVKEVRKTFLELEQDKLDALFGDYGDLHGKSAEHYARTTFGEWKKGLRQLSGQTLERLIELVPPYLSPGKRYEILQLILKHNKPCGTNMTVRINIKEPLSGFAELDRVLATMQHNDPLSYLPEKVMNAATWLYANDITAARAMLAQADRAENEMTRASAAREINLLRRTIASGQVKAASYSVCMPAGTLYVVAYNPEFCFVATACCGACAPETQALRYWRDEYLIEHQWGRKFVVWYYMNGEQLAALVQRYPPLKNILRHFIKFFANCISRNIWRIK